VIAHVVWDWNGTLFDDLHVVVEAVNAGIGPLGLEEITLDDYRTHYTRPVKRFYDRLVGREISQHEWLDLDRRFHDAYRERLPTARLAAEAVATLEALRDGSISQSLLSMFPHDELVPLVDRLGIRDYFELINGLRGEPGAQKARFMERHLRELMRHEDPAGVLVIGDTVDDAVAAFHVGARAVLVDNGSHHLHELQASGAPVVATLAEALEAGGLR
jgi:phosphoglycolate phosphatase-like HAD superfamily hydrolase